MSPFYERLPGVAGFGVERTADTIGIALAAGATAGVLAHAAATGVHRMRQGKGTPLPVMTSPPEQSDAPSNEKES